MVGLPPQSPQALDFDVAIMTRADLEELRRTDRASRNEPGMIHLDAEKLGATAIKFGSSGG